MAEANPQPGVAVEPMEMGSVYVFTRGRYTFLIEPKGFAWLLAMVAVFVALANLFYSWVK